MSAICECCENPIQGPPAVDSEGADFCAPCIASLMGEAVREARADAERARLDQISALGQAQDACAEVERLRAEIERLHAMDEGIAADRDEARAEAADWRLRAQDRREQADAMEARLRRLLDQRGKDAADAEDEVERLREDGARQARIAAQRIAAALGGLHQTYTIEGVGIWVFGRKASLNGRMPLALLGDGDVDAFVRAVENVGDWAEPLAHAATGDALCERVGVGRGTDTWDPACDLPSGHDGPCNFTGEPSTEPTGAKDCAGCGAPSGHPPAGPCIDHGTERAVADTGERS